MHYETSHSSLEQTFKTNLAEAPNRSHNMMLTRLLLAIKVVYKPGIKLVANALARVCTTKAEPTTKLHHVNFITEGPIDLQRIKHKTAQDPKLKIVKDVIYKGWSDFRKM